jgi:hypothetical protein
MKMKKKVVRKGTIMEEKNKTREILSLPFVKEVKYGKEREIVYWCVRSSGDLEKDLNKGWKYGKIALRLLARGHDKSLLVFILLDMRKYTKKSLIEFGFLEQIAYAAKTSAELFLDTKFVETGRLSKKQITTVKKVAAVRKKTDNELRQDIMNIAPILQKILETGNKDDREELDLSIRIIHRMQEVSEQRGKAAAA